MNLYFLRRYLVGVIGVSLDTYNAFSLVEVAIKISGYHMKLELENYLPARRIFTIIHNANSRHGKSESTLWPLQLDNEAKEARRRWMDAHADKERLRAWAFENAITV